MSDAATIQAILTDLAQKPHRVKVGNTSMANVRISDLVKYLEYLKADEAMTAAQAAETVPGLRTNVLKPAGSVA